MSERDSGSCLAMFILLVAVFLVVAVAVAAVITVAALVDPFSWVPPTAEIFTGCSFLDVPAGDCKLSTRFPGFWPHVIVNLLYAIAAAGALIWLGAAALEVRRARAERFSGEEAVERYTTALGTFAMAASVAALLAAAPLIVAVV